MMEPHSQDVSMGQDPLPNSNSQSQDAEERQNALMEFQEERSSPASLTSEHQHDERMNEPGNDRQTSPVPKLEHNPQNQLYDIPNSKHNTSLVIHPGMDSFLDDVDIPMSDAPQATEATQATETTEAIPKNWQEPPSMDSDDDLIEVSKYSASRVAQERWAMPRSPIVISDDEGVTKVKQEPGVEGLNVPQQNATSSVAEKILAAQKEMMRNMISQFATSGKNVRSNETQASSSSAAPSQFSSIFGARRKAAKENTQSQDPTFGQGTTSSDERNLVDEVMAAPQEDHSWMLENNGDDEYETLKVLKENLEKKRNHHGISQDEMIELLQIRDRMEMIEKLRAAGNGEEEEEEEEDENELFIPEKFSALRQAHRDKRPKREKQPDHPESEQGNSQVSMNDYDIALAQILKGTSSSDGNGSSSKKAAAKPRKKAVKNAKEFFEREEEQRREKERKSLQRSKSRKGKGKAVATTNPRNKGKGKGKGSASSQSSANAGASKATASKTFMRQADDTARKMLADLLHNDAIADRVRAGFDPEPEISANNKKSQLEQIIASVPKNINLRQTGKDKQEILQASKSFGYAKIKAEDGKWLPKGMKSSLYHHQLLGARFMLERELSKNKPSGGINADAMGLGKTVEMLATMVGNPPSERDKKNKMKTTLLVLPSAVISQWETEIRKHVKENIFPRVMHYKASRKIPLITLEDQDIVLCSYNEVMYSYPYPDAAALQKIGTGGLEKWLQNADALKGDLHKVRWYRIVLDEAHAIKNYKGRTSLACHGLQGMYRWCLTGTPVLNRIEELYSYLRFLRIPATDSYREFVRWFCDPDATDCQSRITAVLSFSMIRRSMNTKLLGRPIISLPDPHPEIQYIDLSMEERIIYRITEDRFRANINIHFSNGTEQRNYGVFMVQLLRLRQCASHPFMIEQTIKECWTAEDLAHLRRRLKSLNKNKDKEHPMYQRCKIWVEEVQNGGNGEEDGEIAAFGRGQYGHEFKISKYLKGTASANQEEFIERVICSLCSDVPKEPQITDCNHIFCKDCLTGYMHEKAAQDGTYTECPTCQLVFSTTRPYQNDDIEFPDDDLADGSGHDSDNSQGSRRRGGPAPHRKGNDILGFEPSTKPSAWLAQSDVTKDMALLPSAKTIALKAKLLNWFHDAPNDKIVIFTQFRLLARIVGRIAEEEKWQFLYYTGDAKDDHRTRVVDCFHNDPNVRLLIAGLKCGGQGLNLTAANRCISLDLWWNHAVEQQAFGRTFRMGQKKETYFTRICVRNTVEMRMLAMQADKLQIIERMMNEGEDVKKPQLDTKELAALFGYLNEDPDGNFHVTPDYVEEENDILDNADADGNNDDVVDLDIAGEGEPEPEPEVEPEQELMEVDD